jgi:hypothetical protein
MESIPIVISLLALLLGAVNFYWMFLKSRKSFHVVNIEEIERGLFPEFALVNGGKKDLLITKLVCSFVNEKEKSSFTPSQRIEFKESDSFLISQGKGIHCKVEFVEKFTTSFVRRGSLESSNQNQLYFHDMCLDIGWVEMDGGRHEVSVKLLRYGFRETGEIASRKMLVNQVNLYRSKP